MAADGVMECHEVKGHWQDDARAKIKIAAAMSVPLHCGEGQAQARWRWLGSGGILMDGTHATAQTQARTAGRTLAVECSVEQDGAPGIIHSNRGEFGPR